MPSSYTPLLRLVLPVTGELTGTWGDTVNKGITPLVEAAVAGTASVTMTDADYTLTTANEATDEARNAVIVLSGTLTASRNVICPASSKLYIVRNATTGGFPIVFKTAAGTGITVANGTTRFLRCDGTNVIEAFSVFGGSSPLEVDVASAATTDIGGLNTAIVRVTGITTITSFGTNYNGPRFVRFAGALTLTHNATTLILPGGANITTAAGDRAILTPVGNPGSGWQVLDYIPATGNYNSAQNGPLAGLRNLLINGNFAINQRAYVSGAAVGAANTYTLDRWRVVTSGENLTFSASGNGNQITAPAGGLEQVIEGLSIVGGSYVLNWAGTATATVGGTARTKGEVFTLTAGANVTVRFTGGTVSVAQLEPGTVATPFEARPYGLEDLLCKRYFCKVPVFARGFPAGAGFIETPGYFPTEMRVAPTLTPEGSITQANVSTESAANITTAGFKYSIQTTGSADSYVIGRVYAASAEL